MPYNGAMDSPCNAGAIRKASRRVTQLYDDALAPSGLRSTQYTILFELSRRVNDPPTMRELAAVLIMDRSALGHTVRPLERDGLIALVPSTKDRRLTLLTLTAAGRARCREAQRLWQQGQDHFENIVGKDEAAALRRALLVIARDERLARVGIEQ